VRVPEVVSFVLAPREARVRKASAFDMGSVAVIAVAVAAEAAAGFVATGAVVGMNSPRGLWIVFATSTKEGRAV
jgi:hypothetical protein